MHLKVDTMEHLLDWWILHVFAEFAAVPSIAVMESTKIKAPSNDRLCFALSMHSDCVPVPRAQLCLNTICSSCSFLLYLFSIPRSIFWISFSLRPHHHPHFCSLLPDFEHSQHTLVLAFLFDFIKVASRIANVHSPWRFIYWIECLAFFVVGKA